MTFEQFQATGRDVPCIQRATNMDLGVDGDAPGRVYDRWLTIEAVTQSWPADARNRGEWCLTIENEITIGNDLQELERKLYDWAATEFEWSRDDGQ